MIWVFRALLGHWRRHPVELATLLAGLAVATALWSGVQALNAQARASYAAATAAFGGDALVSILPADGGSLGIGDYVALRRAGWEVSPVLEGELPFGGGPLSVIGVEPLTAPAELIEAGGGGDWLAEFLLPPYAALAAPETVERLEGAEDLPPRALREGLPPDTILVDIGVAERLLGTPGVLSRLMMEEERPLPAELADRLRVSPPAAGGEMGRLTDSFHLNLTAFGLLAFIVGLFIVYAAIGLAFEQRRPMLRTLRATGVSAGALAGAMLTELVLIALLAGLAGVAGGYLLAGALLPDVAASLRGLYGARVAGGLSLSPWWWLAGVAISVAGALTAAGGSLWQAWRMPLLAAAKPEAWMRAETRRRRWRLGAAGLLWLGAIGFLSGGDSLVAGFAGMGAMLLGAALALPSFLAAILAAGARLSRGAMSQWIWADARQQVPGLSLALMALLLALAANVGVGAMVQSFRLTFLDWLDQRLSAEIYVSAETGDEAAAIAFWAEAQGAGALPLWEAETRYDAWPVEVQGFRDHAAYRQSWALIEALPGAWDLTAGGDAILVSEQMARRFDLWPGADIALPTPAGPWETRVAGVYADYGNPLGQVMMAQEALAARWIEIDRTRLALRVDPSETAATIAALRAEFALPASRAVDQQRVKAAATEIFERTFVVTMALNALTLLVAGIALVTSLLTLFGLRLVQAAPAWAIGVTRRDLALIEMARTVALAALTALAALPLGLCTAWVLTAVINVQAFGWRLPVYLFPGQWAGLFGLALATACVSALWPVAQLWRATPSDLLRGFSNER